MVTFRYCPIDTTELVDHKGFPHCPMCYRTFWRNSKPCVGVLIVDSDKVLLARRGVAPFKNHYDLIGGFLEEGEHPEVGARREIKEETGLEIALDGLVGIYIDRYGEDGDYTLNINYRGHILHGEPEAKDDVAALEWVSMTDLPEHNLGFSNTKRALHDLQLWYTTNHARD